MISQCPACFGDNLTYKWSQPSLTGGMEYDVYKCEDCDTFTEVKPEYIVLADSDAIAVEARPECPEGMNW
jgi:hypothetical protein